MLSLLKSQLTEKRYNHSVSTAEMAVSLAKRYGVSPAKAQIAGLLHDCARAIPTGNLLQAAQQRGLDILPIEKKQPILLHAVLGAIIAKEQYQVTDEDILSAIAYHTVGAAKMSDLDKVIYLSDLLEPTRQPPVFEKLRAMISTASLNELIVAAFNQSIIHIIDKGQLIHPQTILARNNILSSEN